MKIVISRKVVADEDAPGFLGCFASAELAFPYGQGTICCSLSSPGLWGIEPGSPEDSSLDAYLQSVFLEEVETLKGMIEALRLGPIEYEIAAD